MPAKTKAPKEKVVVASPSVTQKGVAASNVDGAQALKAFKALSAHAAKRKADPSSSTSATDLPLDGPQGDLRDPSNAVYVQITINSLNAVSKVKPVRINLAHALHAPGSTSVCLLVKDPQREYKDLLTAHKIKSVERVVGVTKLKGKFKPFDARRALVQEHDLFLADQRIVPLLPTLCGKVFFDAKKHPITVNLQKSGAAALQAELDGAIKSTSFLQNKGSCSSVKLGYLSSHTPQQLADNLLSALPAIISRIQGGWNNVHNIDVKTGNSAALPIWNQRLGVKTHVVDPPTAEIPTQVTPAAPVEDEESEEEDEEESEAEEDVAKPVTPKKISPRKTRSAAARVKAADSISASAPTTPVKSMAGTPRKVASSVSKSARKAR